MEHFFSLEFVYNLHLVPDCDQDINIIEMDIINVWIDATALRRIVALTTARSPQLCIKIQLNPSCV